VSDALRQYLERHRDEQLAFVQRLVRADTTTLGHGILGGEERRGQIVVGERLRTMGCGALDSWEPDNAELESAFYEFNRGHAYAGRPNLVGTFKGTGGGRSLILNGHVDVMPAGDVSQWSCPPFGATVRDGQLIGRGACDMKGGLAAGILALEAVRGAGIPLRGDVIVESVVDEEGGGNGTMACVARGYWADGAIVCEPTSLTIHHAHMGWLFFKVTTTGKALHSAQLWLGVNAISKAIKLIQALDELQLRWLMTRRMPGLPGPTINVGEIEGGIAGSVVPDHCVFRTCLHYLPSDAASDGTGQDVEREVREHLLGVAQGDEWLRGHPPEIEKYQEGSPFWLDPDHLLVQTLRSVATERLGRTPAVRGSEFGTDARLLNNPGRTPTVIFGPGNASEAHAIDEKLDLDQFFKAIDVYANMIVAWAG
jgi:acetylornithine deacetylase